MILAILLAGICAFLVTLVATPLAIKIAEHFDLVDDPAKKTHAKVIHERITPRAGGLPIFIGILITSIIFLPFDKRLAWIMIGGIALVAMGILDDKYDISPYKRLSVQFVSAALPIIGGVGIAFITNPFGGIIDLSHPRIAFNLLGPHEIWIISDIFALFWIVTIMNFVNMGAKGVDGQMTGVIGIAAFFITLLSMKFLNDPREWIVIVLSAITAGSFFGFLPWHIYPQKIMPGFSGSAIAGYFLAILAIMTTTKVGALALILAVPLIDTGYTVIRRVASGKSPVWGDTGHLHHKLLAIGWHKKQIAYLYWSVTILTGILSLKLRSETKLYTMIGLILLVGGALLWLTKKQKKSSV